jgi:hypothetical protein
MLEHSPRASPLGAEPPVGTPHVKRKHRPKARGRRARSRICLRKGCRRKYRPRCWNQRYCQEPECRRQVRRWQAARRQAEHRQDGFAKAQHAQAQRAHRQRTKSASQVVRDPEVTPARGHAAKVSFPLLCDRPGCYEPPVTSVRNPARYCCPACCRAVRNVQDRERKWLSRGTLDGRTKRAYEYQAACQQRLRLRNTSASIPFRAPPE